MKLRTIVILVLVIVAATLGFNYIRLSLRKAATPPTPSRTPSLADAPARLYGLLEPDGREVYVGPLQARRVVAVLAKEGDRVTQGQALCQLDDDLERQALRVAESRLEEAVRQVRITQDEFLRIDDLARKKAATEFDATRLRLRVQLEEQKAETARAEVELRRTELAKLVLRSPIDGQVYKLDVRVGEHLTPQDYERIVVGRPERQVRLFVETFWMDRVAVGQRFRVLEAETLREVGTGKVESVSAYVGSRDFRTEDKLERIDTKYAQAVLRLDGPSSAPIGMQVLCERLGEESSAPPPEFR